MSARNEDTITVALVRMALAWKRLPKRQQEALLKVLAAAVKQGGAS